MTDKARCAQVNTNTVQTQEDTSLLIFYCHIHIYALYSLQGVQTIVDENQRTSGRQRLKVPIMSVAPAVRRVKG